MQRRLALLLFVLVVLAAGSYILYRRFLTHPSLMITAIAQKSLDNQPLKSVFLAECLGLDVDHPLFFYQLDKEAGKKALEAVPVIANADIRRVFPSTLYIDYELRTPIAFLRDYSNTALDSSGHLFPFYPFFTPKCLPDIYIGCQDKDSSADWQVLNKALKRSADKGERLALALEVLLEAQEILKEQNASLSLIDVSASQNPSLGQQQIVVSLQIHGDKEGQEHWLRLPKTGWKIALKQYFQLNSYLKDMAHAKLLVDLRLAPYAFITGL